MTGPSVPPATGLGASIVRTVVPLLVGLLLGQAARIGLNLDEGAVTNIVTGVVTAAYYAAARWLEANVSDQYGRWLLSLGLTRAKPSYTKPPR